MSHRASFDHNCLVVDCKEETSAGAQAGALASTSTEEAPGAMAVEQAEVAGSSHGCATVCEANVQGYPRQESESHPEESDYYDEDDLSISDLDTSDPEQEEAAPLVAAVAPPTAPAATAIEIPGPHRSRHGRRRRHRGTPFQFAEWQVEEMENLFEVTQYPDVLTRRSLARTLNVPEVKVKVWFTNRRAKQRKNERRAMLRNMPPGAEVFIFMIDVEEPS